MQQKIEQLQKQKDVTILAIESSCDETSVAVVRNGRVVLSNVISSQIEIHKRFGGVVPEVASRNHTMCISSVLEEALKKANLTLNEIDAVAVTYGAGLVGALLVGVSFAKGLSYALQKPLIAVNHIRGHVSANFIAHKNLTPPFICLIVSGGHSAIVRVNDYVNYSLIGTTQDDAIGEATDKIARVMGLSYPGGPKVDKLAKEGQNNIKFINSNTFADSYKFSYSGLKTAVINYIHKQTQKGEEINKADICCSFQHQAIDGLLDKTISACKQFNINKVAVAGGVSANSYLREQLSLKASQNNIEAFIPPLEYCTDNAAMIGAMAYFNLMNNVGISDLTLNAVPNIPLE